MREFSLEVVRKIFDDAAGVCIQVGPGQDGIPGVVSIYTEGSKNEEWYGKIDLPLTPTQARLLAEALIDRAHEAENEVTE